MKSSWTAGSWLLKCASVHILLMSQSFDSVLEKAKIFFWYSWSSKFSVHAQPAWFGVLVCGLWKASQYFVKQNRIILRCLYSYKKREVTVLQWFWYPTVDMSWILYVESDLCPLILSFYFESLFLFHKCKPCLNMLQSLSFWHEFSQFSPIYRNLGF